MDANKFEALSGILESEGLDANIQPEPSQDENVIYFDVVAEMAELRPHKLLNAFKKAQEEGLIDMAPTMIAAQPYCITFDDR